ncbi:unnamed protein product, partial [Allacma fusca]
VFRQANATCGVSSKQSPTLPSTVGVNGGVGWLGPRAQPEEPEIQRKYNSWGWNRLRSFRDLILQMRMVELCIVRMPCVKILRNSPREI